MPLSPDAAEFISTSTIKSRKPAGKLLKIQT
jgi:hypothetical protein